MESDTNIIAFTICSNNYLAQAKTLQKSLLKFNNKIQFFIGLVDKPHPDIDYKGEFDNAVIVMNDNIVPCFTELINKYDIVELNTAVKPFLFQYLIQEYDPVIVHYFDPDIQVYNSLAELHSELKNASLLLTPHFYSPIQDDGLQPFENLALNHGIYNLGYLGVNASHPETKDFLDWWSRRTQLHGFSKLCEGFFVDQLWVNLAPVFFKGVVITNHFGCNMGPWNLHERRLSTKNKSVFFKNETLDLVFYHFSSFSPRTPDLLSKYYNRYSLRSREDLVNLYENYCKEVEENGFYFYSKFDCQLNIVRPQRVSRKSAAKRAVSSFIRKVWKKIYDTTSLNKQTKDNS